MVLIIFKCAHWGEHLHARISGHLKDTSSNTSALKPCPAPYHKEALVYQPQEFGSTDLQNP